MPSSFNADDNNLMEPGSESFPEAFSKACTDSWQLCGEGVFSWSVFRFYRARLLTHTGTFDPAKPFLLDLHYLRALPGKQIVSASIDEIARLNTAIEGLPEPITYTADGKTIEKTTNANNEVVFYVKEIGFFLFLLP